MSLEDEIAELSTMYHSTREYIEELERGMRDCNTKIAALEEIITGLADLTPACASKTRLLRKYQALKPRKPPEEPLEGISGI